MDVAERSRSQESLGTRPFNAWAAKLGQKLPDFRPNYYAAPFLAVRHHCQSHSLRYWKAKFGKKGAYGICYPVAHCSLTYVRQPAGARSATDAILASFGD